MFAVIIPVNSTATDMWRCLELVRSLVYWEPDVACCVFLEDSPSPLGMAELPNLPDSCLAVAFSNPLKSLGHLWHGGLADGILSALRWIYAHTAVDFVLKIDVDALVIGPFATAVGRCLLSSPTAGAIGVIGGSCNPQQRAWWYRHRPTEAPISKAYKEWPRHDDLDEDRESNVFGSARPRGIAVGQLRLFDALRPHIETARSNGYHRYQDCQGGAYVVSHLMMERLAKYGYAEITKSWRGLPFGEDQIVSMYAYAVGLTIADFSSPGDPFGVQSTGLAYPPDTLVRLGYSLIHSVKNDTRWNETEIRRYFRDRQS